MFVALLLFCCAALLGRRSARDHRGRHASTSATVCGARRRQRAHLNRHDCTAVSLRSIAGKFVCLFFFVMLIILLLLLLLFFNCMQRAAHDERRLSVDMRDDVERPKFR